SDACAVGLRAISSRRFPTCDIGHWLIRTIFKAAATRRRASSSARSPVAPTAMRGTRANIQRSRRRQETQRPHARFVGKVRQRIRTELSVQRCPSEPCARGDRREEHRRLHEPPYLLIPSHRLSDSEHWRVYSGRRNPGIERRE